MSALADNKAEQAMQKRDAAPRHVAIIMDGNGRWATSRGLVRIEGHRRGVEAVRHTIRGAMELGIRHLTLYSFSSENWNRPRDEIDMLFGLFRMFVRRDVRRLHEMGVRIRVIGRRDGLPDDICRLITEAEDKTRDNRQLQVIFAFNYGARDEILRATREIAAKTASGALDPNDIRESTISDHLDTTAIPDPDLIVRTSGEMRLSNFLLWQCAYSELVFLPIFWPDFRKEHLEEAIGLYEGRTRRYGGVEARAGA